MPRITDAELSRLKQSNRAATKDETSSLIERVESDRARLVQVEEENASLLQMRQIPAGQKPRGRR